MMTVFGATALLLAAIGIYGLMAYAVEQRRREIGIRLALGALVGDVQRMIVLQGLRLAVIGMVLGVAAAYGLARFIEAFVFGLSARDPLVFILAPATLLAVAVMAVLLPALRASRLDPVVALRDE